MGFDPVFVEGFIEGCLERIGEDNPDEGDRFQDLWDDETQREVVIESFRADCEVRREETSGALRDRLTEIGGGCLCGGVREIPLEDGC